MPLFLPTAALALAASWFVAGRLSAARDTRGWLTLAGVALQNAFISQFLSAFGLLTPGAWFSLQCVIAVVAILVAHRIPSRPVFIPHPEKEPREAHVLVAALWTLTAAALAGSFWRVLSQPVWGFDETMYHFSRVMLAIQERTMYLAPTHNERQTAFPWGSEIWLLWPMLFVRAEWAARLLFWTAYPLTCWGVRSVLVRLRAGRLTRATGVALWAVTPLVFRHGIMQKPELWAALWFLGVLWGIVRAFDGTNASNPATQKRIWVFIGLCAALTVHVRNTSLPLLPALAVVVLLTPSATVADRVRKLTGFVAALLVGLLATGVVLHSAHNHAQHGGLFGSKDIQRNVRAGLLSSESLIHLGRIQFDLFELPVFPVGNEWAGNVGMRAATVLGLAKALPGETEVWPGLFEFVMPRRAIRLGLGGLLWTPLLVISFVFAVRRRRKEPELAARVGALAWASGATAVVVAMSLVRSMTRYLLAPYAAVPILAVMLAARKPMWLRVLGVVILIQGGVLLAGDVVAGKWPPVEPRVVWDDMNAVNRALPPDARILLAGSQDCPDYLLFGRETGYRRVVVPWGFRPVRRNDLGHLLVSRDIDTVVVENPEVLGRDWLPAVDPRPLIGALTEMGWRPRRDAGTTHTLVLGQPGTR